MLGWWVAVSAVAGGPTHVDVRACRERVAAVDALFLAGRTDEAWAAAEESGRACAAVGLRARPRDADRWYRRYDDLVEEGLNDEALPFATREAIATLASQGPGHAETATSLNGLALLLMETGAYDLAERHLRRALDVRRRILEPDHPLLAQSLNNLALLLHVTASP